MGLLAAEDISICAYVDSLIQSAYVRAIKRKHARAGPKIYHIFANAQPVLYSLKPSLFAAPDGILPPCDPLLLFEILNLNKRF